MSNPDFQQALRDLAQAEQMRSAGESARNSRKLLEAQEKQAEIEKQKLKIEQIRLQEERERHQAIAKKAEAQKTIRVAMAGVEEELDQLLRRANSTRESELVDGLSSLSFLAVLAEKKLKLVIQSEGQLEDLGDIRFVRSLKQKFQEIRERHPNYFGEAILQRALETLRKVAFWAQETKCFNDSDISIPVFLNEGDLTIRSVARVELADSKNCFDIILKEAGTNKIGVIKEVRAAVAGLGLAEAMALVECAPKAIKEGVAKEEAEDIKKKVEAVGAKAEINVDLHLLSISKIEQFIESIEQLKQKTSLARTRITEAWNIREGLASNLRGYGIADSELNFLFEAELDPISEKLLQRTHRHQSRAEKLGGSLVQLKMDWTHDRDLLESAKKSLLEAKFGEAEKASKQFKRTTWSDLDVSGINKALTQKRDSVVQELDALGSDKTAAINLAQKLAVEYSSSPTIADTLKNYQIKLMSELVEQRNKRRRNITLAGLLLCGSTAGVLGFMNKQEKEKKANIVRLEKQRVAATEAAERAERERIAAAELAEKARIAAAERAEEERVAAAERAEKERIADVEAQEWRAKAVSEGKAVLDAEGHAFMLVPKGSFQMGSNNEIDERPIHPVNVSAFFVGETEVTYGEWKTVLGWAKSKGYEFKSEGKGDGEKHPLTHVNWYDAVKWCNAKSEKEGLVVCYKVNAAVYRNGEESGVMCDWSANGYRLPTEAEWEKAARGGLEGMKYPNGDSFENMDANFEGTGTTKVGKYPANGYGLRDMAGNVSEWCWDWYKNDCYQKDVGADPKGASTGDYRVLRGGGWYTLGNYFSVSRRSSVAPSFNSPAGFRVIRRYSVGTTAAKGDSSTQMKDQRDKDGATSREKKKDENRLPVKINQSSSFSQKTEFYRYAENLREKSLQLIDDESSALHKTIGRTSNSGRGR